MTCPACASWCATSEEKLANRLKNMAETPSAKPYVCPRCKGTDWATSREKIVQSAPKRRWWQIHPPSWRELRIAHAFAFMLLLIFAWSDGLSIIGMVGMFLAGYNFAGVLNCTAQIRLQASFDRIVETCNEMHVVNAALLGEIAMLHMERLSDDTPPTAPTLQ